MRIRGTLLAAAAISLLLVAGAQESAEAPIDVVERAMGQLAVSDYRFSYDLYPSVDATSRIRGEGEYDADTSSWHYTLQADPTDPGADQSKNGEWLVAGGMPSFNGGNGWEMSFDFTYMGIGSATTPFGMYRTLEMMADPDAGNLEPLTLLGRESVDGAEADHYSFATTEMPVVGTGRFDIWLSPEGDGFGRVIVEVSRVDRTDRVVYYDIGQDVTIEAPQ